MNFIKLIIISSVFLTYLNGDTHYFKNTENALNSFIKAVEKRDKEAFSLIFTPRYKEIVRLTHANYEDLDFFVKSYKLSHRLVSFDAKEVYIEIGNGWTFPVPLVHTSKGWYYDIDRGIDNVITRGIGKNELALIELFSNEEIVFEDLSQHYLSSTYKFIRDETRIVAIPKDYQKSGIMSFVRTQDAEIFEADLQNGKYIFDERFKKI